MAEVKALFVRPFRRAAVLQPGRVVVVFNVIDAVGKSRTPPRSSPYIRLVRAVAAAALGLDELVGTVSASSPASSLT